MSDRSVITVQSNLDHPNWLGLGKNVQIIKVRINKVMIFMIDYIIMTDCISPCLAALPTKELCCAPLRQFYSAFVPGILL